MAITPRMRRRGSLWLLAALLLSQVIGLGVTPQTAQAATTAPNAEPSEEIVFLDNEGRIRVYDRETNPDLPGNPTVDWSSPSGGWGYIDLGDFNNDGDMEIAALRQVGSDFQWTIFDPVVARGATNPDRKTPNGIPWDILYESTPESGEIQFIVAGNFDDGIPGDELAIGWQDSANYTHVRIMKAASRGSDGNPTGRDWEQHTQGDFNQRYSFGAAGNIYRDESPADELVLVDKDSSRSRMDVFRVDRNWEVAEDKSSTTQELREVAIGQIIAGGPEEIALIRSTASPTENSLIVYEMRRVDGEYELVEDETWAFAPKPEVVFLADITGNGDQEVWFLRKHPHEDGARLIMRDEWGSDDSLFEDDPIEKSLDEDNGYLAGVGADVDGDGKDEIVIMRDDRIRIYTRPDESMGDSTIVEHRVNTNQRTIRAGNLDAAGYIEGPTFGVSRTRIEASVPVGTVSGDFAVDIQNITTPDPVTFQVFKPGDAPWMTITPAVATTPATINVRFNATSLPIGTYISQFTINAPGVLNSPVTIEVELTVTPAVISFGAVGAAHVTYPCGEPNAGSISDVITVRVGGTVGLNYRAALVALPSQAAAASEEVTAANLADAVAGAEIADNGDIILYDAQGNTRTFATGIPAGLPAGGDVSASAVLSTAWPIDPAINWVTSVSSNQTAVPSDIRFEFDTSSLPAEYGLRQAVLVLVADTSAGTPPENVFALPVSTMCARSQLVLPLSLK